MKILIAGGYGAFCETLTERLKREKHDIYIISGEKISSKDGVSKDNSIREISHGLISKVINYDFDLTDEKVKFIINSIMPDGIIFLGAVDENYDFMSDEKVTATSMTYLAGLSNLLIIASSLNISRFTYISTSEVYGEKLRHLQERPSKGYGAFTEKDEKKPDDIKSLVISEGETMCLEFNKMTDMRTVILRFSDMYGVSSSLSSENRSARGDICRALFEDALNPARPPEKPFAPTEEKYLSPIYVSDAVDAVYKTLIYDKGERSIFNVSSEKVALSYIYKKIKSITGLNTADEAIPDKEGELRQEPADLTVDSELFSDVYGYKSIIGIDAGLERTYRQLQKQKKTEQKAVQKKKINIFKSVVPFVENILVFALMVFLDIFFTQKYPAFAQIDFILIYILIIAIMFGMFQASIAILLGIGFIILGSGSSLLDAVINLDTIVRFLVLFALGVVCGQTRDNMRVTLAEKNLELENTQSELQTIYSINDSNIRIKQELDERLKNYDDSLAKIYSVVEKLNSLQPESVFFSAIDVIMEIMKASDVSIYIITGDNFKMCRLMAKTPSSVRVQRKSIPLADMGELAQCMERDEIFVNRSLDESMPMMASPIFSNQKLVSIIMLWSVEFENLTLYNINRFLVLSRLISSIIERAYIYTQNVQETQYLPGMRVMMEEAFLSLLNVYKKAEKSNTSSYCMIVVSGTNAETGSPMHLNEIYETVHPLLRLTDYMGECGDSDEKMYILLTNTGTGDAQFVLNRLAGAGLQAEETKL